ncbi:hypothetical protein F2P56_015739 [Juglans regia]|uniref:2-oxoglutarate-dependent dioxygenase AOP2-like n=2 Tax=Juglans regia TaxID=51240 RepID=A0A2I4H856_JUGRE|nr:2-oxoglutarate-dependent dioxygenase AOP2-like [Juglans regia]KAF5465761.1 hypothetical protein F2P56_015739 [Juglans regia]
MAIQTQAKIPVLDFSNENLKPGTASWSSVREQVCSALEEHGYFVAELGNKVPLELHDTMFDAVRELFDFPTETKQKVIYEKPYHGYSSIADLHERMVIDNATSPEETQRVTSIFWPDGNDRFRESADSYVRLMKELDQMVTRMLFENYGVEKYYDSHMDLTTRSLGFLKYKERDIDDDGDQKTGLSRTEGLPSHADKHFTSILHQNRVKGLEIKTNDGEWICFDPSPTSFILLAAESLQVWSNDRIQACFHRVMMTENETRHSLGLFAFNDGVISVPAELVDEEHPLRYKPLNLIDFLKAQAVHATALSVKAFCGV